jgi:hypothetical protein
MSETARRQEALDALTELQRYLADEVAPLMVTDSMELLVKLAPEHSAAAVKGWLEAQSGDTPTSDYLYHAVKKLHLFAEFQLVEPARFQRYLAGVSRCLLPLCPPAEQGALKLKLSYIGQSETTLSAPVRLLHRELGSEEEERQLEELQEQADAEHAEDSQEHAEATPRFTLLTRQLQQDGADAEQRRQALVPELLSTAAIESRSGTQFEAMIESLREAGIDAKLEEVFKLLARKLPGWTVRGEDGEDDTGEPGKLIQAMHRIVATAGSRDESGKRFGEMVYAAIEQFNDGHLAQAVAMFDVAARLLEEGKVDPEVAKIVRRRAQGSVSIAPLRRFAPQTSKHGLLRRVLRFFPAFTPGGLLERLDGEPKRDVRRLLLSLIEVHGPPCRHIVMDRLLSATSGEIADYEGYYKRNLVYLLRRIPDAENDDHGHEIGVLSSLIEPGNPLMLAKEALGALGQFADPRAEAALITRLRALEQQLVRGEETAYTSEECDSLFERICAALARIGTKGAVRAVVRHTHAPSSKALGDTFSRLDTLSGCNVAVDPASLDTLLQTLRNMLPKRVLRMSIGGNEHAILHHVRALASTTTPAVHELLERVAGDFKGREFADAASEVLANRRAEQAEAEARAESSSEGLKGDLELFGLPVLLQSLADSKSTGELTIADARGQTRSTLWFSGGGITACQTARLSGLDGVCQLFERPEAGTFRFEAGKQGEAAAGNEPLEVLHVLMEGLRRHDEFQETRALVPDGSVLAATGVSPQPSPEEDDAELTKAIWEQAAAGTPPETCESSVRRDAFTVRRLYAWWLEQGALGRAAA